LSLRAELNITDPELQGAVSRDASETVKMPAINIIEIARPSGASISAYNTTAYLSANREPTHPRQVKFSARVSCIVAVFDHHKSEATLGKSA
jgi:hypothetical protein